MSENWEETFLKFTQRAAIWRRANLPFLYSVLVHNMFIHSLFSFKMQFFLFPESLIKQTYHSTLGLFKGPGNWITMEWLYSLRELFQFPMFVRCLQSTNYASLLRVLLTLPSSIRSRTKLTALPRDIRSMSLLSHLWTAFDQVSTWHENPRTTLRAIQRDHPKDWP